MFSQFSYKQKLKFIGVASLLSLFLCYRLSISHTVEEYRKYTQESGIAAEQAGGAPSLAGLQARETRVGELFTRYTLDTLQPAKNLLSVSSNYCKTHQLQLKEYKPYSLSRNDSIPVLTRTVTVGGAFIPCLKFLYELESAQQVGRVAAVDFRGYTDPQDKKLKLDCTLYIQNLIPSNHEDH
jgi:hypothetical protein